MTGTPNDFPRINPMPQSPDDETICGYPIRDLMIFADACRVAGIGPKELKDFVGNVEAAYSVAVRAMDEHLARCLEEYLRPTTIYENEEVEEDVLIEALKKNTGKIEKKANDCYAEYRKYLQEKVKTLEEELASLRDGAEGEEGRKHQEKLLIAWNGVGESMASLAFVRAVYTEILIATMAVSEKCTKKPLNLFRTWKSN